jgi:Transposase DDE domain group 1
MLRPATLAPTPPPTTSRSSIWRSSSSRARWSRPRRSSCADGDAVELERLHRARANAEDRVRAAKQTGLENLPFRDFDHNAVWLEVSLIAQDIIAWTQRHALDAELAVCEPKTLRYRLLHIAGRLVSTPPRDAAPATHVALGPRTRARLRPAGRATTTRRLTVSRPPTTTRRRSLPTTPPRRPSTTGTLPLQATPEQPHDTRLAIQRPATRRTPRDHRREHSHQESY